MLDTRNRERDPRDRGLLLEQLHQLNAPRYTLGGLSSLWGTPTGKKDVNAHKQYLGDIQGPMEALFPIVDGVYQMEGHFFFGSIKELFDRIKQKFEDNLQWYSEKAKNIQDALTTFQHIVNMLTQANSRIQQYLSGRGYATDNEISTAIEACYPPLKAYIDYMQSFVPKK